MHLVIYRLTNNILFNSVAKICYTDLLYRETLNGSPRQVLMENPVRFITIPSRVQPNMKAAKKFLGNPLLVNYAHDYLIM